MGELAVGRAGKVGEWQNQGEDVGKLRDGEARRGKLRSKNKCSFRLHEIQT